MVKRLQVSFEMEFGDLVRLYQESFPESERKPIAVLRRMLAEETYHFLLATENELTVGFAIVRTLVGDTAALLEYMAVVPSQRGRGFGGQILLAAANAVNAPTVTLLLEVESDREQCPDQTLQTRRKQFYRSMGARELSGLNWIMPPVASTPPPPMEMLAFVTEDDVIRKDRLRQWLINIYVEVYEQSADDPRIDSMLAGLPDEVPLV